MDNQLIMVTVILDVPSEIEIPTIQNLAEFRRWALSREFPDRGRIDYIAGRIEVEMSPEDLFTHGTLKTQVAGRIEQRVKDLDIGHAFCGETRISSVPGDLSCEPDIVVITYDAMDQGRVALIPKASGQEGRYVEVDGAVDLIVEIVSDGSVRKDTVRLPKSYFEAGVREFWLIDARGDQLVFEVYHRGEERFVAAAQDQNHQQRSDVLQAWCGLQRDRHSRGHWDYQLSISPLR